MLVESTPVRLAALLLWLAFSIEAVCAPAQMVRVLRTASGTVETVDLESYVAAVLPGEIGTKVPLAAMQAQAVAARSYAAGRMGRHEADGADMCDTTHCQVYRGLRAATHASKEATGSTRGLVLMYKGRVVPAPFHAHCGGRTAKPSDVWDDEETVDLAGVEDDTCTNPAESAWTFHLSRLSLAKLGVQLGLPGARYLEVYGRDEGGRVATMRLLAPGGRPILIRGFDFRKVAMATFGWDSVRSTAFELLETRSEYVISGRGHGHGAGLCQTGAIRRAERGEKFREILTHYYPGVDVVSLAKQAPAQKPARPQTAETR